MLHAAEFYSNTDLNATIESFIKCVSNYLEWYNQCPNMLIDMSKDQGLSNKTGRLPEQFRAAAS
jgi:hypothetical protein